MSNTEQKNARWLDWVLISCLVLMLFLASYSLETTEWMEGLNKVTAVALLGGIFGMLLGYTQFKKKQVLILISLYSLVVLSLVFIFSGDGEGVWLDSYLHFVGRIKIAIHQLINIIPLEEGILFQLFSGIFFWCMGVWTGFFLLRWGKPWFPLLLCGAFLLSTQYFQSTVYRSVIISGGYALLSLVMLGRLQLVKIARNWSQNSATIDFETSKSIIRVLISFSLILVIFSWSIPYFSKVLTRGTVEQKKVATQIENTWDKLENFFAPLRQKPIAKEVQYGDVLPLGVGQPLSEELLFTVITPSADYFNGRYYWQAREKQFFR